MSSLNDISPLFTALVLSPRMATIVFLNVIRQNNHDALVDGDYISCLVNEMVKRKLPWPDTKVSSLVLIFHASRFQISILILYSLLSKTSYPEISRNLEAARYIFRVFRSFWNFTGVSTGALPRSLSNHYDDVIKNTIASQITSLKIVYSIFYSSADQRKHQSSASLAFVRGIHRWSVNSPHKGPVTWKMFPFDDIVMFQKDALILRLDIAASRFSRS